MTTDSSAAQAAQGVPAGGAAEPEFAQFIAALRVIPVVEIVPAG